MRAALRLAAIATVTLSLAGCSDRDGARRFLEDQGYTNVRMLGGVWFGGCGEHDNYRDEFRATNANSREVHGVVCSSFTILGGQSSHIRFYDQ